MIALFEKAKEYLKYPKITLALPDGSPLQLSLAGNGSQVPRHRQHDRWRQLRRQQMVRQGDEGRRVGAGKALRPAEDRSALDPRPARTQPAEPAARHGKLTGHCCFCNSELSDEKSTAVGYGPVCAKRWGLPHGKADCNQLLLSLTRLLPE